MPRQVKVKRAVAISSSKSTTSTATADDNNHHTKQQITNLQNRITSLNKQRQEELESRKYMSSCPERIYSFGKYKFFEKKVNEKFDNMISILQHDVNELQSLIAQEQPISPDGMSDGGNGGGDSGDSNNSRPTKKRRRRGVHKDDTADNDGLDSSSDSDESEIYKKGLDNQQEVDEDEESSMTSKFSYISDQSNRKQHSANQSDDASSSDEESNNKCTKKNEEVIDLAGSSSSSDSSSDEESEEDDSVAIGKGKLKKYDSDNSNSDDDEEEEDLTFDNNGNGGLALDDEQQKSTKGNNDTALELDMESDNDDNEEEDKEEEDDEDEDDNNGEIERYHISKIKQSKLTMATQGFRCQAAATMSNGSTDTDTDMTDDDATCSNKAKHGTRLEDHTPFDPSSIEYQNKTFHTNQCYTLKGGDAIVGIKHFTSKDTAYCVLIVRFEDTLLGTEDEGLEYKADYLLNTHVQVYNCNENISLSKLGDESDNVERIPRLIYQPQTHGDWYTFGYFYDRNELMTRRIKRRIGNVRSLECFVGAGGSLQGYKNVGFETICAIDNDHDAIATLKLNHPKLNTYEGDIQDFIEHAGVIGRVDHIHWSSPCQDFSQANRSLNGSTQVAGKRDRADLSLLLVDYVQLKRPLTAVFENVCGIYQRKNVHYLKNITKKLMQLGYQVRCTVLKACDYGDPQGRPRFFMFISRNNIPMPSIPARTHGDAPHLWPFVTTKEALEQVNDSLPNIQGRTSSLLPQHGVFRLKPHECAPTIRASSVTFHHSKDRCINVREAATLQSFPLDYKFCGSLSSQYKQIGNAVPVELASAVANSIKQVLMYEYKEEEDMASDIY